MRHHQHTSQACRDLLAQLSDYIDDELEASLCTRLEQHLQDCHDCRVLVDTTKKTILLYRQHYRTTLPPEVLSRLWQRLEDEGCQ